MNNKLVETTSTAPSLQTLLSNITLKDYAKANCRKCHGRGYTALNKTTKKLIICHCAKKNYIELQKIVNEHNARQAAHFPEKKRWHFFKKLVAYIKKLWYK